MIDATTLLIVGGAFATPMLFEHAAALGVPVQAYVTGGQAAAMAVLNAPIAGAPAPAAGAPSSTLQQAYSRFLTIRRQLDTQPQVSFDDLDAIREAFSNAAQAGYNAPTEPYEVATGGTCGALAAAGQLGIDPTQGLGPTVRAECWNSLPDDYLTELGQALQVLRNDGVELAARVPGTDPTPYLNHVGDVALAMDAQGYRPQGPPLTYSAGDAASAAGEFWKNAASKGLDWILGEGLAVLGKIALSTPGLIVIGVGALWLVRR